MTARQRLMARWSRDHETVAVTKAQLDSALSATETFIASHAATYNNMIPQPARDLLTASQKAEILAAVALARWES